MLTTQIILGTILICFTVVIQAIALDQLKVALDATENYFRVKFERSWKIPVLTMTVLGVFAALVAQIWLWAFFYLWVGALTDFEEFLYFSTSTFTTVGYGDIVLGKDWRLVSSFQSANGFILFGWSTAFIFEVMSELYKSDSK